MRGLAFLVLAATLAGCFGQPQQEISAPVVAPVQETDWFDYDMANCEANAILFFVDFEKMIEHLPAGVLPRGAEDLFGATADEVAFGKVVAMGAVFSCPANGSNLFTDGRPWAFGFFAAFIESPKNEFESRGGDANLDFYVPEIFTGADDFVQKIQRWNPNVTIADVRAENSNFTTVPSAPSVPVQPVETGGQGTGRIETFDGTLLGYDFVTPVPLTAEVASIDFSENPLRLWVPTTMGTLILDFRFEGQVPVGAPSDCTVKSATFLYNMTGRTDCRPAVPNPSGTATDSTDGVVAVMISERPGSGRTTWIPEAIY